MKTKKEISYTYMKPTNKTYIKDLSRKTGQSMSYCLDELVDAVRLKRDLNIKAKPAKVAVKSRPHTNVRQSMGN